VLISNTEQEKFFEIDNEKDDSIGLHVAKELCTNLGGEMSMTHERG